MQPRGWTIVVPVRLGNGAKRRLAAPPQVPAAMAADCLAAAAATTQVARVVVVAPDGPLPALPAGVEVVRQPAGQAGLRAAIGLGLAVAAGPTGVLLADLPALRPGALGAALGAGAVLLGDGAPCWHVPDADGSGTVLLAAGSPADLPVRFGPGSARAHGEAGSVSLPGQSARLRRDVDTPSDLLAAWDLGPGPHSAATITDVQVTVLSFSADTGDGEVVTDDGLTMPLGAGALAGSGLRHLRPGQRLTCLVSDRIVVAVRINGIGDPLR